MIQELSEALYKILQEELTVHTQCETIAQLMNDALKTKNCEQVRKLTAQFDAWCANIEELESKRLALCDEIVTIVKPQHQHMNLHTIIRNMPHELHDKFNCLHRDLKKKIQALVKINTVNQILLKESLLLIEKNVQLRLNTQQCNAGYRNSGNKDSKTVYANIVNRIA